MNKTAALLTSSADERWATDRAFFKRVHLLHGFGLDAAAHKHTACLPNYLGPDHVEVDRRDALNDVSWSEWCPAGKAIWCNPPYGAKLTPFMQRAAREGRHRHVVCLVPARLCAKWFHKARRAATLGEYISGRMVFLEHDTMAPKFDKNGDPMPSTSGHILFHFKPGRPGLNKGELCPLVPVNQYLHPLR